MRRKVANQGDAIEVCPSKHSELNSMERWNELIAGYVLGNLTPEEAATIAEILAENPQLAGNIARLRNTATVRSLRQTEWSTARSQDGSEGWADTALDLPMPSVVLAEVATNAIGPATPRKTLAAAGPVKTTLTKEKRAKETPPFIQLERFSAIEALLVPLFNPVWWTVFAVAIALGVDGLRVRRSLADTLEEMSQLKAVPQQPNLEQPIIAE